MGIHAEYRRLVTEQATNAAAPSHRVAIVGAGPAGLMAADVVSAAGIAVTIYERMPTAGRKLLMAGRGGLNLTHSEPLAAFLGRYGPAADWLAPRIARFGPANTIGFAHELGQPTFVGSSGRIFPRSMKASPLLRAWLERLAARGVAIATGHTWRGFDAADRLQLETSEGGTRLADADATILALGGASWPRLGSDGRWREEVLGWGVDVRTFEPANCGIDVPWSEAMRRHAGAPLKRIAIAIGERRAVGEAIVTVRGLEGGAIYGLVPAVRDALRTTGSACITVDVRPNETVEALARRLARPRGKASTATFLAKAIDLAPVARALLHEACGRTLPSDPVDLARLVKAVPVSVTGLAGLERAISSAGGVALDEIDADGMLRRRPGVFVAGEMLDWEAPTGGYLLQAALATGHAAGEGVLRWLDRGGTQSSAAAHVTGSS